MDKIKETLANIGSFFKSRFSSLSKKTIITISAVAAALMVSAAVAAAAMSQVRYEVLFSSASADEVSEIVTYARETLGVRDVKINADGDILVPEDKAEEMRVSMSIAGFPKSTFNYDIWKNGLTTFSTEKELRELQKQQIQDSLAAILSCFENVDSAVVILGIPEESGYVIDGDGEGITASVSLVLSGGLTAKQTEGIYNLVVNSVSGLLRENITINCGENGLTESSDDRELRELQKQQIQDSLKATLSCFEYVDSADVVLVIPEDSGYVIGGDVEGITATVSLVLSRELTAEQTEGIYNLVADSVPGLLRENITILLK